MKLLTHNMLTSNIIKGVKNGYPLKIMATDVVTKQVDFNSTFIIRMIPKLDWNALYQAAENIGHQDDIPKELVPDYEHDEEFLKKAHKILLEVEVQEGSLICPETGRKFTIKNGIPNMLLNEDEL